MKKSIFAFLLLILFASPVFGQTIISSVPYTCNSAGTTYRLDRNLTSSSGNAITINANNVTLDLYGYTLTHVGNGVYVNAGITGFTLTSSSGANGKLTQSGSGTICNVTGSGGGRTYILEKTDYTIVGGSDSAAIGLQTTSTSSEIRYSTFTISGSGRVNVTLENSGIAAKFHHNTVTYKNKTGLYPLGVHAGTNQEIYNNTFVTESTAQQVNAIACWDQQNVKIHDNTFNWAGTASSDGGGRIILQDCGCDGMEVYNNIFNVTSVMTDTLYVFRPRCVEGPVSGWTSGAFYHNTIDYSSGSGPIVGIEIGEDYTCSGLNIYSNKFRGSGNFITTYAPSIHTNTVHVYCNDLESTSEIPITMLGGETISGWYYGNNRVVSGATYEASVGSIGTGSATWCGNNTNGPLSCSDVSGAGCSTSFTFTTGTCTYGTTGCWADAGAPSGVTPPTPASFVISISGGGSLK